MIEREVDGDAEQPRAERGLEAKRDEPLEYAHEGVLRDVLRVLLDGDVPANEPQDGSLVFPDEHVEGGAVAREEARDRGVVWIFARGFVHHRIA